MWAVVLVHVVRGLCARVWCMYAWFECAVVLWVDVVVVLWVHVVVVFVVFVVVLVSVIARVPGVRDQRHS